MEGGGDEAEPSRGLHGYRVRILGPPLTKWDIWGKLINLFVHQFSQLKNGMTVPTL